MLKHLLMFAMCLLLQSCTNTFLQPMRIHVASPEQFNIRYEDVFFTSGDGLKLHGWWFDASAGPGEPVLGNILFLHGNAQNISTHAGMAYWLTQHGYNVFIFDYRGYGKSEGKADIAGAIQDIQAARDYLVKRTDEVPVFVVSHSLGASMGIYSLALDHTGVDGAIFVVPFSEYARVAGEMLSQHWLGWWFQWLSPVVVSDRYSPINVVGQLEHLPKMFAYSDDDQIIAKSHVISLYEESTGQRHLLRLKGQHNQLFANPGNQQHILNQLDQWRAKR